MKKVIFVFLIFCFSLTIISCGDDKEEFTDTDTTSPVIAEVTAVTTPSTDFTPNYTFSSTEAGTITYGGSCSSNTTSASSGNNTITFISLSDGTYSDCTIIVTDAAGNASNTLTITSFEVLPSYVAVGSSGTMLTSSDGISWDNKSSGTSLTLSGVTYGNNKFLTLGISGSTRTMLTSSNGTSWTSTSWTCSDCRPDPDNNSSNQTYNFTLEDVTYGNSTFVAVGTSGTILTSSDGISWDNKSSGTSLTLSGVTYGNNKFLTLGISGSTRTMLTSSNGTSWTSTSWTCSDCRPDPDNNSSNQTYNFTLEDVTYKE